MDRIQNNDDVAPNGEQAEETNLFRITNTKVIGLLAAAVIFVASYSITGVINSPHRRIDALAKDNNRRFDELVKKFDHVHTDLEDIKYDVAQTERNDLECDMRNDRQQKDIDMLKKMGGECVNWRSKAEVEIIQLNEFYKWYSHRERLPD